jgi:two-component system sensor histidine kinase DesK
MKVLRTEGVQEIAKTGEQPDEVDEITALSGISPRLWRLYAYFWLICLIFPIVYLAHTPLTEVRLLLAMTGLAIFITAYLWVMWPYPLIDQEESESGLRDSAIIPVVTTLLVLVLSLVYGNAFSWLFLGVSAMIGVLLPARQAFWAVTGLTLLTLAVILIKRDSLSGIDWLQALPLVLLVRGLGLDMTGLTRLAGALRELNIARQELAHQAVMEERLRVARDLHDLLGHTLSLIALKSELARRLIEKDSPQAAQEVIEIERAARQALREVRETITGYRQQTLSSELDAGRQILEAAGITCRIENTIKFLPPDLDVALAWTVREGVTNVIRHSRAKLCTIRISRNDIMVRAEVINDGYRGPENLVNEPGTGISGLTERIGALGGTITACPYSLENKPGFHLLAELPLQANSDRKEGQNK